MYACPTASTLNSLTSGAITAKKNGYVYIYVSNESTESADVYFDNLNVQQMHGPLVEEDSYYPFGLAMKGLSSKALNFGSPDNKFKYNGKELQSAEFSDGGGLEEYDYGARMYDVQIGRWNVIDNLAEESDYLSPYVLCQNQPISRLDPDGSKDKPFNAKTDEPYIIDHYSKTLVFTYKNGIPDGKPTGLQPYAIRANAFNCHSFAWENSQGDPTDISNKKNIASYGVTRWDEDPTNNIVQLKAKQLDKEEPNKMGDRVIYYVDKNGNGKWDVGEVIIHSAIVANVDKDGNTVKVFAKNGEDGFSLNHPDAPDYYKVDPKTKKKTSLAYFRLPENSTTENDDKENDYNPNKVTWFEAALIIGQWLQENPNIQITIN